MCAKSGSAESSRELLKGQRTGSEASGQCSSLFCFRCPSSAGESHTHKEPHLLSVPEEHEVDGLSPVPSQDVPQGTSSNSSHSCFGLMPLLWASQG